MGFKLYEGRKILVYDTPYPNQIPLLDSLDPHFSDTGALSPLARFEPTERGWQEACRCAADQGLEPV